MLLSTFLIDILLHIKQMDWTQIITTLDGVLPAACDTFISFKVTMVQTNILHIKLENEHI